MSRDSDGSGTSANPQTPPSLVSHADWSVNPKKRWIASAVWRGGRYEVLEPRPVGETRSLVRRQLEAAEGAGVLLGFDFPIGVPSRYAERAEVTSFLEFLRRLASAPWRSFFDLAETPKQISVRRPFYPAGNGTGTHPEDLLHALGVETMKELLRECEHGNEGRGAACSLFWTVGAKQVGRGALVGWRDVLIPALLAPIRTGFWPFEGPLHGLIAEREVVLAETYPTEYYSSLGIELGRPGKGSKTVQADRAQQADPIIRAAADMDVEVSASVREAICDGFGNLPGGDDRFDALVGLLGMLRVVTCSQAPDEPGDHPRLQVEGWILGQPREAEIDRDEAVGQLAARVMVAAETLLPPELSTNTGWRRWASERLGDLSRRVRNSERLRYHTPELSSTQLEYLALGLARAFLYASVVHLRAARDRGDFGELPGTYNHYKDSESTLRRDQEVLARSAEIARDFGENRLAARLEDLSQFADLRMWWRDEFDGMLTGERTGPRDEASTIIAETCETAFEGNARRMQIASLLCRDLLDEDVSQKALARRLAHRRSASKNKDTSA